MRTQSAPVPSSRPTDAVRSVALRKTRRAAIVRRHSRSEKLTSIAGVALAVVLLAAGATYQMTAEDARTRDPQVAHPFMHSRAARVVIPTDVAGRCREHSFDNDRGGFGEARDVACDQERPRTMKGAGEGFTSFKEAFGGKK